MYGRGKSNLPVQQEWAWTLQRLEIDPDEVVWQALEADDMNPDTYRWRPPKDEEHD